MQEPRLYPEKPEEPWVHVQSGKKKKIPIPVAKLTQLILCRF